MLVGIEDERLSRPGHRLTRACNSNDVSMCIIQLFDQETHLTGDWLCGAVNVCFEEVRPLPAGGLATRGILNGFERDRQSVLQK